MKLDKKLQAAAKVVIKDFKNHMSTDGWDLSYSILIKEVFYLAYGHHLEDYFRAELAKLKTPYYLILGEYGLLLSKKKPKKSGGFLVTGKKSKKVRRE